MLDSSDLKMDPSDKLFAIVMLVIMPAVFIGMILLDILG